MIEVQPIDEFREVRRRLSDEHGGDPVRYADMLRRVWQSVPGSYVTEPLRPGTGAPSEESAEP